MGYDNPETVLCATNQRLLTSYAGRNHGDVVREMAPKRRRRQ